MAIIESNNTIKGTLGPFRYAGVPSNTTHVGSLKGALLTNTLTGIVYVNQGTLTTPDWKVLGEQEVA